MSNSAAAAVVGRPTNPVRPDPYTWYVVKGRLYSRRDDEPWGERAYYIHHDRRTVELSGRLSSEGIAAAVDLAMVELDGLTVERPTVFKAATFQRVAPSGQVWFNGQLYKLVPWPWER